MLIKKSRKSDDPDDIHETDELFFNLNQSKLESMWCDYFVKSFFDPDGR